MASVKFPRKEFEKNIKLTKEIEDKINLFGTHVESLTDSEIEIEVLPNRPDLFSMQGYVRAISAFIGKSPGLKKYTVSSSGEKLIVKKPLPKNWVYAYACIVKGVKFDNERIKEVIQIQEKLGATLLRNRKKGGIGLYPLDKISFPITFKGMNPDEIMFRPLEYPEIITGRQVLARHPTGREYAHLVSDWDVFPVFVDSKGVIMSMPPIINAHEVGKIDENTKNVFVECTGTDPNVIKKALIILLTALAEMGGKIHSIECTQQDGEKESFPDLSPEKMKLSLDNANKLIGLDLKENEVERFLAKMGHDYKKGTVSVAPWRTDVLHEVDLIEDIAIAYGYDKIQPEIPKVSTIGGESRASQIKSKIAEALIGLGFLEISSYHLVKEDEIKRNKGLEKIEVEDSKTEYKYLRPSLLVPALRIFSENKDNEYPQKIFEIGTVFLKDNKIETGIGESSHLIVASSPANFTELKQVLEYLFRSFGIKCSLKESVKDGFIEGRVGEVISNGKSIGVIGEMHPETLREWGIKMPIAFLEINLDPFLA
ncbi:phenylalanine--tRNA ligase subunit beta [Candidatus Pacearchaeota archaeon]|nr:phenylalanine--tRNA ligase subunit beta [Candidatus Pacearchaeota archaeon]